MSTTPTRTPPRRPPPPAPPHPAPLVPTIPPHKRGGETSQKRHYISAETVFAWKSLSPSPPVIAVNGVSLCHTHTHPCPLFFVHSAETHAFSLFLHVCVHPNVSPLTPLFFIALSSVSCFFIPVPLTHLSFRPPLDLSHSTTNKMCVLVASRLFLSLSLYLSCLPRATPFSLYLLFS